jgi:hypothetical protein
MEEIKKDLEAESNALIFRIDLAVQKTILANFLKDSDKIKVILKLNERLINDVKYFRLKSVLDLMQNSDLSVKDFKARQGYSCLFFEKNELKKCFNESCQVGVLVTADWRLNDMEKEYIG